MTGNTRVFCCGILLLLGLALNSQCLAKPRSGQMFEMLDVTPVKWETPYRKNGVTFHPGWAAAEFGRFNFLACIDAEGRGSLVTVQAPGGGELPAGHQKLLVAVEGAKTVIFQLKLPLFDSGQPARLQPVIAVRSEELFSVLPKPVVPMLPEDYHKIRTIRWSKVQSKAEYQYIQGSINTSAGRLEVFWRNVKGKNPQLMLWQNPGSGERLPLEELLYIWEDSVRGTTVIFQERHPLLHQKGISCLWPVATVKTVQLVKGMQHVL